MGKNDNSPSQPSFLELRAPSVPNTPTNQLQLHPELAPAGVLEWSCSRQSWSHAKQALSNCAMVFPPKTDLTFLGCV